MTFGLWDFAVFKVRVKACCNSLIPAKLWLVYYSNLNSCLPHCYNKQFAMNAREYIGDLTAGALFVAESRVVTESLLRHLSEDDWKELIMEENILQKRSGNTAIRYARAIRRRLSSLGDDFQHAIVNAPESEYIQLLMMALLIRTPVIADFMREVVADSRRLYQPSLAPNAWGQFLDDRIRTFPDLAILSDSTLKKTGSNIVRALVEAGYLNSNREKKLQPVYLLPVTRYWLNKLNRNDLEKVMECTL